jgi:hypothetical protein
MKLKLLVIALLGLLPITVRAQKAFEFEYYKGTLQGKSVKLNLANGYIGATEIYFAGQPGKHPIKYQPESGVADSPFILRCTDNKRADYFALSNVQEAYEKLPAYISAKYYNGKQVIMLKFYRVKH